MTRTMAISVARANWPRVVDAARCRGERTIITRDGEWVAAVVSVADLVLLESLSPTPAPLQHACDRVYDPADGLGAYMEVNPLHESSWSGDGVSGVNQYRTSETGHSSHVRADHRRLQGTPSSGDGGVGSRPTTPTRLTPAPLHPAPPGAA